MTNLFKLIECRDKMNQLIKDLQNTGNEVYRTEGLRLESRIWGEPEMIYVYPDKEYIKEYKDWMKTTEILLSDLSHIVGSNNELGKNIIDVLMLFSQKNQKVLKYLNDVEFYDRKSYCTGYNTGADGGECSTRPLTGFACVRSKGVADAFGI